MSDRNVGGRPLTIVGHTDEANLSVREVGWAANDAATHSDNVGTGIARAQAHMRIAAAEWVQERAALTRLLDAFDRAITHHEEAVRLANQQLGEAA